MEQFFESLLAMCSKATKYVLVTFIILISKKPNKKLAYFEQAIICVSHNKLSSIANSNLKPC